MDVDGLEPSLEVGTYGGARALPEFASLATYTSVALALRRSRAGVLHAAAWGGAAISAAGLRFGSYFARRLRALSIRVGS